MSLSTAQWIVTALVAYLSAGLVLAVFFVSLALARVDPAAEGMPWTARLLLVPGVAVLWPLMLWKWLFQRQPPAA
jgi:hypothetical protein